MLSSINRYERKKQIETALLAAEIIKGKNEESILVIAGGYDKKVKENVEYAKEIQKLCTELGLKWVEINCKEVQIPTQYDVDVLFLYSISHDQKLYLLKKSCCLIYTPQNEHFGIVPVESMYCGTPVVAANSGGPLETIRDGETGYTTDPTPEKFAEKIELVRKNQKTMRDKCTHSTLR